VINSDKYFFSYLKILIMTWFSEYIISRPQLALIGGYFLLLDFGWVSTQEFKQNGTPFPIPHNFIGLINNNR